ncbi:hypothetical protein TRP66_18760 [Pseudomonas sp. JDS28PS106]|uniref:hypothetical protein n=1 Tax=Pseudomonas sp. JDS28PS106 TaxID=2497235 RepID=UPI002FD3836D
MIVREGEVITIASGIFEGYDRAGPFVTLQDIDVDAFVVAAIGQLTERVEINSILREIPKILSEQGLIAGMPCRRIYLGAMGEVDISEEKEEL